MDDPGNAIEVRRLCKRFNTHRRSNSLKDLVVYRERRDDTRVREVLHDVSFSVPKGGVLGIIGRNGSGKSTMLKLLTRILRPNEGTVETDGKIACLIELGAGFHPDMTGRENIYINASIFGIPKGVIDERFDDIVEFSGIGEFIDERIRNYSSGMYLRLAFSVAINVDADILLVDEILTVGDIQFQKKCMDRLKAFRDAGGTIVLVTHNIEQTTDICDNIIWLDDGRVREEGAAAEVCAHYKEAMLGPGTEGT